MTSPSPNQQLQPDSQDGNPLEQATAPAQDQARNLASVHAPQWLIEAAQRASALIAAEAEALQSERSEKFQVFQAVSSAIAEVLDYPESARQIARRLTAVESENGRVVAGLVERFRESIPVADSLYGADRELRGAAHLLLHIKPDIVIKDLYRQLCYHPKDFHNLTLSGACIKLVQSLNRDELLDFIVRTKDAEPPTDARDPVGHAAEQLFVAIRTTGLHFRHCIERLLSAAEHGKQPEHAAELSARLYLLHARTAELEAEDRDLLEKIYTTGGYNFITPLIDKNFPEERARSIYYEALLQGTVPAASALADYLRISSSSQSQLLIDLLDQGPSELTPDLCQYLLDRGLAPTGPEVIRQRITSGVFLENSPERLIELAALMWKAPTSKQATATVSNVFDTIRISGENLEALERAVNLLQISQERIELSELVFSGYPFEQLLIACCNEEQSLRRENARFILSYLDQSYGEDFLPGIMRSYLSGDQPEAEGTRQILRFLSEKGD